MPTKYHVQQGWHMVKDNFSIKDEDGKECYKVKGTTFTWGSQLTFCDMEGNELATIKQTKVVTLKPKFEIHRDGKLWAECSKENLPGFGKKETSVNIPGDNNYKIIGDRVAWNFDITTEDGTKVAEVNKKWGIRDNYGVKVEDGVADPLELLILTVMIDQIYHDDDE